jgi:MFS family permease
MGNCYMLLTYGYKRNISLVFIYNFFRYTFFFIPFLTPFFLNNNITYSQIFILHFVFAIGILFLEIPLGYFADRYGRKNAMILSSVFFIIGLLGYAVGSTFWEFFIVEIFWAIGYAFYSGTYHALLFDSLLHLRRAREYTRLVGQTLAVQRGAEILASLAAGFLVLFGIRFLFYLSIIPALLLIIVVFFMKEPTIKKEQIGLGHWHHMGKVMRDAYDHPPVFWFSVYTAIITGTMFAAIWAFQAVWTTYDINITVFGYLWVALQVASGSGSLVAFWLEKKIGIHLSFFSIALFMFLGILLSGLLPFTFSIVFMCFSMFLWGFSVPLTHNALNKLIPSSRRATVLSFKSMLSRVFHVCFTLMISFVLLSQSLEFSMVILAFILGAVSSYSLYRLHALGVF